MTENLLEGQQERGNFQGQGNYYAAIDACPMPGGKILVLYAKPADSKNFADSLIRFGIEGNKEVEFNLGLKFAHSITATGSGTYLISDHGANRLLEIDGGGRVILEVFDKQLGINGFNFNSAVITPKKTFLASARDWGIAEFDRKARILWRYKVIEGEVPTVMEKGSHDATLLDNGNVMYVSTTTNEVIEIDRKGRQVWSFSHEIIRLPKNAKRLKNGNTIISHSNGLLEITAKGNIVRKNSELKSCYNFKVQSNGTIILSHTIHGVLLLDNNFKIVSALQYRAPESWETLKASLPPENIERLKSLGYLR